MNPVTPSTSRPRALTVILAVGALGAVLALTGCINGTPTTNTPTATQSPSKTPTPTATATATATPGVPVTLKCSAILTPQQVYDYNPNYGPKNNYQPAPTSLAALAASQQGRVCAWINESSAATLEIAVSRPGDLSTVRSEAAAGGTSVQLTGGATGYFETSNGIGRIQAFRGSYWVIISAADIGEVADAQPLAQAVLGNIPAS